MSRRLGAAGAVPLTAGASLAGKFFSFDPDSAQAARTTRAAAKINRGKGFII
jgi:hypothetical protein